MNIPQVDKRASQRDSLSKQIWRFLFVFASFYFLFLVRFALVPLVLGILLAYIINPLLKYFEHFNLKRTYMLIVIYLLFTVLIVMLLIFLIPVIGNELTDLKDSLPNLPDQLKTKTQSVQVFLEKYIPPAYVESIFDAGTNNLKDFSVLALKTAPGKILNVFTGFSLFFIVLIISFFFLKDGTKFFHRTAEFIPNKYFERVMHVICKVDTIIGNYLRGQFTESLIVAVLTIAGLFTVKLKYGLLIGIAAGVLNIIPYVGPVVGTVPAVIVSLVIPGSPGFIPVVMVFIIVQLIDNFGLKPIVIGKSVEIHPIAVFMALLIGGSLFGFLGILLAIPAYACLKVIVNILYRELILDIGFKN